MPLTNNSKWAKFVMIVFWANTLASVLGLCGNLIRAGEMASHFRVQYLVVSITALAGFLTLRYWRWGVVASLLVVLNALIIIPQFYFTAHAQRAAPMIRLMLSNVYHGNKNYEGFLKLVRQENPDLLITQETSAGWREALQALNNEYPYRIYAVQTELDWIMLFSKLPIVESSESSKQNNFPPLLTTLQYQNKSITLFSLHPSTPKSGKGLAGRNLQFETLASVVKNIATPKIIIGDLNSSMWSPYFSKLENDSGLFSVRKGIGILPTWPTYFPPMMIPIDHCLVSSEFRVVNCRTGSNIGSDHLPLIVDLVLEN